MLLKISELKKLPVLNLSESTHNNGGNIYLVNGTLIYKVFKDFYSYKLEIERNVNFQLENSIPNVPRILDKLFIDNKFVGYIMEYIPNSVTFRSALEKEIDLDMKINVIVDIYDALKYLHEANIFLGDIHSDNFLISEEGKGYIIDLDYMRFPGDEFKFQQCYLVKPNNNSNKINIASKYTDNVKVMIASLSLIFDKDLEEYINPKSYDINIQELYEKEVKPRKELDLESYFIRLMRGEDVEYFSDSSYMQKILVKSKIR